MACPSWGIEFDSGLEGRLGELRRIVLDDVYDWAEGLYHVLNASCSECLGECVGESFGEWTVLHCLMSKIGGAGTIASGSH